MTYNRYTMNQKDLKFKPGDVVKISYSERNIKELNSIKKMRENSPGIIVGIKEKIGLKSVYGNDLENYYYYVYEVFVAGSKIEIKEEDLASFD